MTNTENGKQYAFIAAISYLVYVLYNIVTRFVHIIRGYPITAINLLFWLILIGIAVACFTKNRTVLLVAAGAKTLLFAYRLFSLFSLGNVLGFLAYAALLVLAILSVKKNKLAGSIWFLPAACLLAELLIEWNGYRYFNRLSVTWESMLAGIVKLVGLIFAGMWIKKTVAESTDDILVNEQGAFHSQAIGNHAATGGADKLRMYKDLLDSGVITRDEFEAKKKQILGCDNEVLY